MYLPSYKCISNIFKFHQVRVTEIFDLTKDDSMGVDGGIEMVGSHFESQQEKEMKPWSLSMRNDPVGKYDPT